MFGAPIFLLLSGTRTGQRLRLVGQRFRFHYPRRSGHLHATSSSLQSTKLLVTLHRSQRDYLSKSSLPPNNSSCFQTLVIVIPMIAYVILVMCVTVAVLSFPALNTELQLNIFEYGTR